MSGANRSMAGATVQDQVLDSHIQLASTSVMLH